MGAAILERQHWVLLRSCRCGRCFGGRCRGCGFAAARILSSGEPPPAAGAAAGFAPAARILSSGDPPAAGAAAVAAAGLAPAARILSSGEPPPVAGAAAAEQERLWRQACFGVSCGLLWLRSINNRQIAGVDVVPSDIHRAIEFHQSATVHVDGLHLSRSDSRTASVPARWRQQRPTCPSVLFSAAQLFQWSTRFDVPEFVTCTD